MAPAPERHNQGSSYARRLCIWECNYGCDAGWILEQWGEPIALLTEGQWVEMFWDSYLLTPLTQDTMALSELQTEEFWNKADGIVWRHRELRIVAPNAFAGGFEQLKTGRVLMRGLYIKIRPPGVWDLVVLWVRKAMAKPDKRIE